MMSTPSPMHQQVDTLPQLVRDVAHPFDESARNTFDFELCTSIKRIYLTGCGDSHHAPVGAELAFNLLAGVPTQAYQAMTFSHYFASFIPQTGPKTNLVIGVSVSGSVRRTIEALQLGMKAGAVGVALTGNPDAPLAKAAETVFQTTVPPLPDELKGMTVPGVRSYLASQVALYSAAIRIGEVRGHLTTPQADNLRKELYDLGDVIEATIEKCTPICKELAQQWLDAKEYVFLGVGPTYGVAMFSAAKLLEASGDSAMAQETEEWAHLQYFVEKADIPTILISAGGIDAPRAAEVAYAMKRIGRRTAAILPNSEVGIREQVDTVLPVMGDVRECFYPIVASIPGEIFAAERADAIGAEYFRAFGGGREMENEPRTSSIYTSGMLDDLPHV